MTMLDKEARFMLGKSFDGLGVISLLNMNNLIAIGPVTTDEKNARVATYTLNCGGKVSLRYDSHFDLMQVVMSEGVPTHIAENLQTYGETSRNNRELERNKVRGIYSSQ